MFCVGDKVAHPMHGGGVIADIVREKVAGSIQDYYVFRMSVGGLVLKIPTASSRAIGLRPVVCREEAVQLMSAIPAMETEMTGNWNRRYRENLQRLKSGDLYEVARVIKGLASTTWPSLRTSPGFSIRRSAIWEMWIRPSTPGTTSAKAPNCISFTIRTEATSPTL